MENFQAGQRLALTLTNVTKGEPVRTTGSYFAIRIIVGVCPGGMTTPGECSGHLTVITERWPAAPQAAPEEDISIIQGWDSLSTSYDNSSRQLSVSSSQGSGLELRTLLGHPIPCPQSPCEVGVIMPISQMRKQSQRSLVTCSSSHS